MSGSVDRDVLVVGGGSGIGRAVALALAGEGARVTVAGRRQEELARTCELARSDLAEVEIATQVLDVTDAVSLQRAVGSVLDRHGKLDGLVNASGVSGIGPAELVGDDEFARVLDVNLIGAFRLSREVGGAMLDAGSGSIVHLGSLTSTAGFAHRVAYSASKHGLIGLVRTLAIEWASRGVRVNAVCPGFVRTPMTDRAIGVGALEVAEIEARTPMGRRAEPQEMVGPVLFLLSPAASFVTGSCVTADGGWTASIGLSAAAADRPAD